MPKPMTALTTYQRLEGSGLWRDTPGAQRREVVVCFGDASLVMKDPRSDVPLAHWSLPAILRENPGVLPALYAPGQDADESLELTDADMIAALDTVRRAVVHAQPKPGRLRLFILLGLAVSVAAGAVFWLPGLRRHSCSQISPVHAHQLPSVPSSTAL